MPSRDSPHHAIEKVMNLKCVELIKSTEDKNPI